MKKRFHEVREHPRWVVFRDVGMLARSICGIHALPDGEVFKVLHLLEYDHWTGMKLDMKTMHGAQVDFIEAVDKLKTSGFGDVKDGFGSLLVFSQYGETFRCAVVRKICSLDEYIFPFDLLRPVKGAEDIMNVQMRYGIDLSGEVEDER